MSPHRPEHRDIDPHADGVINLDRSIAGGQTRLKCSRCHPDPVRTVPVRYADDPPTVARCAGCGKKHSTDSLEVADT